MLGDERRPPIRAEHRGDVSVPPLTPVPLEVLDRRHEILLLSSVAVVMMKSTMRLKESSLARALPSGVPPLEYFAPDTGWVTSMSVAGRNGTPMLWPAAS